MSAKTATLGLAIVVGAVCALAGQQPAGGGSLMNPDGLTEQAPNAFKVVFETSAGSFVVEAHRDWGPNGADRFYNLVKSGFYDGNRFYRVTPLMAVWGINGNPEIAKTWLGARIHDDPTRKH